jgi:hypothetical protein
MLDAATTRENHERFVRRAIACETVWTVFGESGPLISESSANLEADDDTEPRDVYLFFSDEAYARRALRETWPDVPGGSTKAIPLFDLIFRWLPGMAQDGHLAGTNWTGDLIGVEIEPADLQTELLANLPADLTARYRAMLDATK